MSMFKKTMLAAAATALGFVSISAAAVDYSISIEATVPSQEFAVVPSDSNMTTQTQTMKYTPVSGSDGGRLAPLNIIFDVKSTNIVKAKLNQPAVLEANGGKTIPLTVLFNGVALDAAAAQEVSKGTASAVAKMALKIQTTDEFVSQVGTYTGFVSVVFDAAA
ncbi:CS1 type fimbrial major subunit [Pseudomonas sp. NPDC079086]|uniref:CS1 type fimbrial major subunit n=1 Tax=unclassified Pseudomonas TaxID=196821 RepID=UPI0037C7F7DC